MKIAFIHFHLKTGGVTSVIRQQVASLHSTGGQALVLTGHPGPPPFRTLWGAIPGLAYDQQRDASLSALEIVDAIETEIQIHWPQGPDIIHVHNPLLAKNSLFLKILDHLQTRGYCLLCQVHDFAEDGRPDFVFNQPYPRKCHYVALNQRDYDLLARAGAKAEGLHLLPNPVQPLSIDKIQPLPKMPKVLYPVRAIRRKNIGEAFLLTLFFKPAMQLVITLPPNSEQDIRSYQNWKMFAAKHGLAISFDAGLTHDFNTLVAECQFILTTSITEGFGYAFLEAWTASKAIWGRLLPEICRDFLDQGILLDAMYTRVSVPLEWIDSKNLAQRWKKTLGSKSERLGLSLAKQALQKAWAQVSDHGLIDFGLLDETCQQQIIQRLLQDRRACQALIKLNNFLGEAPPAGSLEENRISHNGDIISKCYHPDQYTRKLMNIYRKAIQTSVIHQVDKTVLARFFLAPQSFSLLKWEPYHG